MLTTLNVADRIESLRREHEADPQNSGLALALEAALRRAGRDDEANKVVIPTVIKEGRAAREYILSSNGKKPRKARFTVVHEAAGKRITFCSQREALTVPGWDQMDDAERKAAVMAAERDERRWVISAMVGSDNDQGYVPFGVLFRDSGRLTFRWASESTIAKTDRTVRVFAWLFESIRRGVMPEGIEFVNEGRCGRCGRVLTVPESRERGIGPVCFGRYHSAQQPVQPCRRNHDHA